MPPCPSPAPRVHPNSCPISRWCHPIISSSVIPFSPCLQLFPASGSFPVSRLFTSSNQSIGASASATAHPMNIQGWFPLGLTGLISLLSRRLSFLLVLSSLQSTFRPHPHVLGHIVTLSFYKRVIWGPEQWVACPSSHLPNNPDFLDQTLSTSPHNNFFQRHLIGVRALSEEQAAPYRNQLKSLPQLLAFLHFQDKETETQDQDPTQTQSLERCEEPR